MTSLCPSHRGAGRRGCPPEGQGEPLTCPGKQGQPWEEPSPEAGPPRGGQQGSPRVRAGRAGLKTSRSSARHRRAEEGRSPRSAQHQLSDLGQDNFHQLSQSAKDAGDWFPTMFLTSRSFIPARGLHSLSQRLNEIIHVKFSAQ